jgi:hypothetical protein
MLVCPTVGPINGDAEDFLVLAGASSLSQSQTIYNLVQRKEKSVSISKVVLLYVDDTCVVSHEPQEAKKSIDKYFPMKPG